MWLERNDPCVRRYRQRAPAVAAFVRTDIDHHWRRDARQVTAKEVRFPTRSGVFVIEDSESAQREVEKEPVRLGETRAGEQAPVRCVKLIHGYFGVFVSQTN
jgi:hypothetical protein